VIDRTRLTEPVERLGTTSRSAVAGHEREAEDRGPAVMGRKPTMLTNPQSDALAAERCVVGDADGESRALITDLLAQVGLEVLEARTGPESLEHARRARPAAVLLDVALPEISGYQVCHILREEYGPDLPIVLLSGDRTEPHDKVAGLLIGADDYVTKPFAPSELLARLGARLRASAPRRADPRADAIATLTPAELRVLRLLAGGKDDKEIAFELSIAPKTVAMHIHNAMKKLDVHTRTQAVVLAHQLGLVAGAEARTDRGADVQAHGNGLEPEDRADDGWLDSELR
jgi:DNA-binding NarL/FixJ family response regulator